MNIATQISQWYDVANHAAEYKTTTLNKDGLEMNDLLQVIHSYQGVIAIDDVTSSDPSFDAEFLDGSWLRVMNPYQEAFCRQLLAGE